MTDFEMEISMGQNAIVTLKKGEGRTIKSGGLWIYDNEIDTIVGSFSNGEIVTVHDFDGYPMGKGFINSNSKILIKRLKNCINISWYRDKDKLLHSLFIVKIESKSV